MLRITVSLLGSVAILAPRLVHAHKGHVAGEFGIVHYLLDPGHGGMWPIVVVLGAGALVWLLGNRPRLRPARARKPRSNEPRRNDQKS